MGNIKTELINGFFWSAIEKYSGFIVSLLVSMILARILTPEDYGVVAVAMVIITFLQMFSTMGIGPAIIQRDDLDDRDYDSIYTFSVIVGTFLSITLISCSWAIASFYKNDKLVVVCIVLSVQLFFASANMVPNALMAKHKLFKDIAKRTLTLQVTTGIISIIAALLGVGLYSLLLSPILTSVGIFLWNKRFFAVHLKSNIDTKPLKRIFSYSFYQLLFEFVNYFSRNLDKLIVGKYMSVANLGFYEKSYRLMQQPMQYLTGVLNPVLQPVLHQCKNDRNQLAENYIKLCTFIAIISFPIGAVMYSMSGEIIRILFGNNWVASIPILKILSLSLPLQLIQATSGAIFLVSDSAKAQFWVGIRNTATTVIGFLIALFWFNTTESIAWAWVITLLINFILTINLIYCIING